MSSVTTRAEAHQERRERMRATGDPSMLAPEVCVEVMSISNTGEEMGKKRALYREMGAEEVWVVSDDGAFWFFADEEIDRSAIAPGCPTHVSLPGAGG